ncbi:MAG: undecaprenyl-diphosphate phosphatase [Oscillospiraceae bacterium]
MLNTIIQAIIQGLTEFLPVSSSGHLSLFQHFTGRSGEGALMVSAVLHLGTLLAVFVCFRKTIWELIKEFVFMIRDIFTKKFHWKTMNGYRRMVIMIIISTACLIPFYIFKGWFEGIAQDSSILAEGFCFLYTAAILFMSCKCTKRHKKPEDITVKDSVTVGFFQCIALLPGVSRSGSTISAGLFSGFSRSLAVQYSFILGIPAILGSCLVEVKEAVTTDAAPIGFGECLVGFVVSAVVGICAIKMVNWLLKSDKFKVFAYYTLAIGTITIIVAIIEAIMGHPISVAG